MTDAVIDEIDGRMIRIGDKWLADFASCNYLGFDLEREIMDAIPAYVEKWGTHPSWSRLLGSPVLYEQIEEHLTGLIGAPDTLVFPTITLIHLSVIPLLAASGSVFVDRRAHKTVYEGAELATLRGATLKRFEHENLNELESLLRSDTSSARLICIDGVNSMTGNVADLSGYAALAREHGAILYVDDAHGFGVIGERSDDEPSPYGRRGNSIVRYSGESYENIVLVAGLSKAYSSLAAFIACPPEMKRLLKTAAPPYLYSGPSPVASLATTICGLEVNDRRGDGIRTDLWMKTRRVLECLDTLGVHTPNRHGLPIVEVPLAHPEQIGDVGRFLFDNGIYVTLAAYPLVPRSEVGFRVQLTAANTDAEIDQLIDVLGLLTNSFDLQAVAERAA
jgi:8-amino-7-oxononanoate synthase